MQASGHSLAAPRPRRCTCIRKPVRISVAAAKGPIMVSRRLRRGFTLVELMIVVLLLAILAAVVVPRLSDHASEARLASLDTNLELMRSAIERYYQEHYNRYPGETDPASGKAPAADARAAFEQQLTSFTDAHGVVSPQRTTTYRFGPYLRAGTIPVNPFTGDNSLVADTSQRSLTADLFDGTSAWKFAIPTGRFVANDAPTHTER